MHRRRRPRRPAPAAAPNPKRKAAQAVRRIAASAAALGFFVLAIVGTLSGVPPFVAGLRAVAGAAILFVLVSVAGRVAASVIAGAVVTAAIEQAEAKDTTGDSAND
jgi:O-antigen ligase